MEKDYRISLCKLRDLCVLCGEVNFTTEDTEDPQRATERVSPGK